MPGEHMARIGMDSHSSLRPTRTAAAAGAPEHACARYPVPMWPCTGGVYRARPGCPARRWALTPPFHPYRGGRSRQGGLVSVALSVPARLPRGTPACAGHPCLRVSGLSSPRRARGGCPMHAACRGGFLFPKMFGQIQHPRARLAGDQAIRFHDVRQHIDRQLNVAARANPVHHRHHHIGRARL